LLALIEGLSSLKKSCPVFLETDSNFLVKGIVEGLPHWRERNWKTLTKKGKIRNVKHFKLWQQVDKLLRACQLEVQFSDASEKTLHQQHCDALAVAAAVEKRRWLRFLPSFVRHPFEPKRKLGDKQLLGHLGETLAADYLKKKLGYKILKRNWWTEFGEIDIVACDKGVLVFVEVRTLSRVFEREPWETVDWRKQKKLVKLAKHYLKRKTHGCEAYRFDIVSIVLPPGEETPKDFKHLIDAFRP